MRACLHRRRGVQGDRARRREPARQGDPLPHRLHAAACGGQAARWRHPDDGRGAVGLRRNETCGSLPMARKDIVVIGASAGGMEALQKLVARLPRGPARRAIRGLAPLAGPEEHPASVLNRAGPLRAAAPGGRRPHRAGPHLCRPQRPSHAAREAATCASRKGPKENRFRPAVDPAVPLGGVRLRPARDRRGADRRARRRHRRPVDHQAARRHRDRAGARGRADARCRSTRSSNVAVDYQLPAAEIGPLLARLVREEPAPERRSSPPRKPRRPRARSSIAEERRPAGGERHALRRAQPVHLPGMPRRAHAAAGRQDRALPLPYRPCALREHAACTGRARSSRQKLWDGIRALDETVMLLNGSASSLRERRYARRRAVLRQGARSARARSGDPRGRHQAERGAQHRGAQGGRRLRKVFSKADAPRSRCAAPSGR